MKPHRTHYSLGPYGSTAASHYHLNSPLFHCFNYECVIYFSWLFSISAPTFVAGIESSLREKWRILKSRLEEANKGSTNGKNHHKAEFFNFNLIKKAISKLPFASVSK